MMKMIAILMLPVEEKPAVKLRKVPLSELKYNLPTIRYGSDSKGTVKFNVLDYSYH